MTWNARHFKSLATKKVKTGLPSYPDMGIIVFTCEEAIGRARLAECIHLIEAEHLHRRRGTTGACWWKSGRRISG